MKKVLTITALLTTLFAAAADAYLGQVVASFPTLSQTKNRGLARSATVLYLITSDNPPIIYRFNPASGALLSWYYLPFSALCSGLAYTPPNYLWVGTFVYDNRGEKDRRPPNYIYRVNSETGSVYSSWTLSHDPYGLDPQCTGDGGAGASGLLSNDSNPSALFTHDLTTGSIVGSVGISALSDYDCAYDWRNGLVWLGGMSSTDVTAYSPSGFVMGSFPVPAGVGSARGLAYANSYLYIASAYGQGYIYVVHCPSPLTDVAPASLGKVKALFR